MIEDSLLLLLKEFIVSIETTEMEEKNQVGKNLMISKQTPLLPSYATILDKGLMLNLFLVTCTTLMWSWLF